RLPLGGLPSHDGLLSMKGGGRGSLPAKGENRYRGVGPDPAGSGLGTALKAVPEETDPSGRSPTGGLRPPFGRRPGGDPRRSPTKVSDLLCDGPPKSGP